MTEQASTARKEYMKQWRKNNKERVKQYQEKYWHKKATEEATPAPIATTPTP